MRGLLLCTSPRAQKIAFFHLKKIKLEFQDKLLSPSKHKVSSNNLFASLIHYVGTANKLSHIIRIYSASMKTYFTKNLRYWNSCERVHRTRIESGSGGSYRELCNLAYMFPPNSMYKYLNFPRWKSIVLLVDSEILEVQSNTCKYVASTSPLT